MGVAGAGTARGTGGSDGRVILMVGAGAPKSRPRAETSCDFGTCTGRGWMIGVATFAGAVADRVR